MQRKKSEEPRRRYFTPAAFLGLLERERLWCRLLLTAICLRDTMRALDAQSTIADELVAQTLERRMQALRN